MQRSLIASHQKCQKIDALRPDSNIVDAYRYIPGYQADRVI